MRKLLVIISALMLIGFTAGITLAVDAPEMIQGKVIKIDTVAGKITVKAQDVEQTLTVETTLLESIKTGDMVEIEKAGDIVKSIKVAQAPPADLNAASAPASETSVR